VTKEQIEAVLERIRSWPKSRQEELVGIVLDMDAEVAGRTYRASKEELEAIDRGLTDADHAKFATEDEVTAVFSKYRGK
jgi:hypothetical protein